MLLNKDQVDLIKQNKICVVKNFVSLNDIYDANFISNLLEENTLKVAQKTFSGNLTDVFQIFKVSDTRKEFKTFFDFLSKIFKYERNKHDEVDLFFGFVSQVGGPHVDPEDVFIIGLQGTTIYRAFNEHKEWEDYYVEKGDMIFIPKGLKHKAIGLTPRIIASIGFYRERIDG